MRTVIEWNNNHHDTESIDNNCKCALGINHKNGRLQWCPGCGYYKIAILIPIIMIPVLVVFFLLIKLEAIHQLQNNHQQYLQNGFVDTMNDDDIGNSEDYSLNSKNFNAFFFPNNNNEEQINNNNNNNYDDDYEAIIDILAANDAVASAINSRFPINDDDNDDDKISNENNNISTKLHKTRTRCVAVKYGMTETTDTEERHILKDVRTSFIPPDFILFPPKCAQIKHNNDDNDIDVNNNDIDDVHDILHRSRRTFTNYQLQQQQEPIEESIAVDGSATIIINNSSSVIRANNYNNNNGESSSYNSETIRILLDTNNGNSNTNTNENDPNQNNQLNSQIDSDTISIGFHFFWTNEETPESIRKAQGEIMKKYMDTSIDPCVDFYQYACGNWAKLNPIPKDKAGYDTFEMLRENLDIVLRDLLTDVETRKKRNSIIQNSIKDKQNNNNEDDDYENFIRTNELRKKIIKKRHTFMKILNKYKLMKEINRKRRHLNLPQYKLRRQERSNENNDNEIDAELKAKYLYQSCMNAELLEKRGIKPLLDLLDQLGGFPVLNSNWNENEFDWLNLTAKLRLYNNDIFIVEWVGPDIKNSDENIIQLDQTSLGLPTRDYFLHESNSKYLDAYKTFMTNIMNLLGANLDTSIKTAKEVIDFEIELAKITSSSEERSNVSLLYKKMTIDDLYDQVSDIDWQRYLTIVQERYIYRNETIVIYAIDYMKKLVVLLSKTNQRTISNYLLWRFIRHRINNLDDRFQESKQNFFNVLFGREESPPRWKNCVGQVNSNMGMAVGAMFVRKYFDENSKKDTLKMTYELQDAFKEILNQTDWLDINTKHLAELKVLSMSLKIGYPDFILNRQELNERYKGLKIDPNKYFENTLNVLRHVTKSEQLKLVEPVNKTNWQTAPAIVNAYYSRNKNQIMFPAGILQPPFYHRYFPRSLNYGGIGVVIGHELTHGFDDKGRLFDKNGNIHKWWTDYAINGFHERAKCLISQYGNYTVTEVGIAVDGESTQGENIADNGGIRQAFHAYENWLNRYNNDPNIMEKETLPGLNMTNKQLFFLNFAQVWCGAMRPEATRNKLKTAVHSPGKFRVIGTLSNSKDFAKEFNCPLGSPMNPQHKCSVW